MQTRTVEAVRATVMAALASTVAWVAAAGSATAQPAEEFYKGRSLTILVGAGAGGGYDTNARLVARHISGFIPGKPATVVTNMPGGGGIRATNVLFNVSERDGSVLGVFSNSMLTAPLLGKGAAKFDASKFTWIGSVAREDGVCIAWNTAGVKTWDDLLKKELIVGTTAPGTSTNMYAVMLNKLFGARFKLVTGFPDASQIILALERGEVQSICQTYSSVVIKNPTWIPERKVYPLVSLGLTRNKAIPDVPTVYEIATSDDQKRILKLILAPTLTGRPVAAPPAIPSDRAAVLRKAFVDMSKDEAFLSDAGKQRITVDITTGEDIQALVGEIYATPSTLIEQAKQAVAAD